MSCKQLHGICFYQDDAVALLVWQRTCYSQVAGSSPGWAPVSIYWPWASYLHLCAFVAKQYNLVPENDGDLFSWESNRGPGGK